MILLGSIVNTAAICIGGLCGMAFGKLLPERMKTTLLAATSLCSLGIAIPGLLQSSSTLVSIAALVLGTLLGELLDIDGKVGAIGDRLQKRFARHGQITEGFVAGSLIFPVGAMAVLGALNSGLLHDHSVLYAKSVIDGVAAMVFASTLGLGIVFSCVSTFVVQGTITLLAGIAAPYLGEAVIGEITFTGSLLIIAISFNIMGITKIKVLNMVPAILLAALLCQL